MRRKMPPRPLWALLALIGGLAPLRAAEVAEGPETVQPATPPADKEKFKLILLVGQSNMAGRGKIDPADNAPHPRVLTLNKKGRWVPAVDPVHWDKKGAGAGLARTFANRYADEHPDITVGLIPAACGGSPIKVWKPGQFFNQTNSRPYDDALARARRAMKDGTLAAILFHQGESDCGDAASKQYHDLLKDFIERLRKDLDAEDVPFVIGQLSRVPDKPWSEAKTRVDAGHRAMATECPRVGFVESEGLTLLADNTHFDTPSLREFGRRYYAAYRLLTAPATPDAEKTE